MDVQAQNVRRKILNVAVSSILVELGFDSADRDALETLTEMLQSFVGEVGQSSRGYCELTGRSEPILADVILGLVNMGVSVQGIEQYANRNYRIVIPPLQQAQPHKQYSMLQAGTRQSHPGHVPSHLPPFPDPHAYIRTPTHKQPVTEYEAIREKAAAQKRDIERALTRFLAKTHDTDNLFDSEDNHMFPLIACRPAFPPYLAALLPQDQVFDPEDLEYDAQPELAEQPPRKRAKPERRAEDTPAPGAAQPSPGVAAGRADGDTDGDGDADAPAGQGAAVSGAAAAAAASSAASSSPWDIDNPYLAATKMPSDDCKD